MSPSFYYFWKKDVPVLLSYRKKDVPVLLFSRKKEVPVLLLFLEKGCPRPFIIFGKRMSPSFYFYRKKKQEDIERRGLRSSGMLISLFFSGFYFLIHLSGVIKYA